MQVFRISEQQYRKFRRRLLAIYIPLFAIAITVIAVTEFITAASGGFPIGLIIVPFMLIYFSFVIYRTLRRQRRIMMSYTLTITDSGITREQDNTPTISISFMEVREIIKTRKGAFLIKGVDRKDLIYILRDLNEDGKLEQKLQSFAPITTDKKDPFMLKYRLTIRLVAIGMFLCLYNIHNKPVNVACALLLSGLLAWSIYETQTSKNVTTYAKRASWLNLLIIAAILYLTYIKVTLPDF